MGSIEGSLVDERERRTTIKILISDSMVYKQAHGANSLDRTLSLL